MGSLRPEKAALSSPVEERHIDFILEEEFASNPRFLRYFVEHAWKVTPQHEQFVVGDDSASPECFRSVTTLEGESDVLVVYTNPSKKRVAVLIEDKIGAPFQHEQSQRYRRRGEEGIKEGRWEHYWTCLVAPSGYAKSNVEFDARVDLEHLTAFFGENTTSARSRFKADVLRRSIDKRATHGVRNVDSAMTEYRVKYAEVAYRFLLGGLWSPEFKSEAFSQDSWFRFFHPQLSRPIQCVHKPLMGVVQLIFPSSATPLLETMIRVEEKRWEQLRLSPVGTKSVAIEYPVRKLGGLHILAVNEGLNRDVAEVCRALGVFSDVILFCQTELKAFGVLPAPASSNVSEPQLPLLRALEAQLFGLMWARAIQFNSPVAFEYPDLSELYAGKVASRFIAVPGMMGGYRIELRLLPDGTPIVFTESESRAGGEGMLNEITFGQIYSESDSVYESQSFEQFVERRMAVQTLR